MSTRDRNLLKAAGLKIPDVTVALSCSRGAIYTGLSQPKHYFTASKTIWLLSEVIRRDSPQLPTLLEFIETTYTTAESDLILPEHVGRSQLKCVARLASRIVVGFDGNINDLTPASLFAKVLADLLTERSDIVKVLVAQEWAQGCMEQKQLCPPHLIVVASAHTYLLPFVLLLRQRRSRVFFFGRYAPSEAHEELAVRLSKYVESVLQKPS